MACAAAAVLLVFACGACGSASPGGREAPPETSEGAPPAAAEVRFEKPTRILSSYEVPVMVEGERTEVVIDTPPGLPELQEAAAREAGGDVRSGLVLHGVEAPRSGVYYDLYAGLPAGSEPDPKGPYHLGTLSSFGPAGEAAAAEVQLGYDLTDQVKTLAAEGRWGGEMTLTLVRRGMEPAAEDGEPTGEAMPEDTPPVRIAMIRIVQR